MYLSITLETLQRKEQGATNGIHSNSPLYLPFTTLIGSVILLFECTCVKIKGMLSYGLLAVYTTRGFSMLLSVVESSVNSKKKTSVIKNNLLKFS